MKQENENGGHLTMPTDAKSSKNRREASSFNEPKLLKVRAAGFRASSPSYFRGQSSLNSTLVRVSLSWSLSNARELVHIFRLMWCYREYELAVNPGPEPVPALQMRKKATKFFLLLKLRRWRLAEGKTKRVR